MRTLIIAALAIGLSGCGSPMTTFGNLTYNVPLAQCKTGKPYPDGHIECYDGKGNYTGNYQPLSTEYLAAYRAQQQQQYNQTMQALSQGNAQLQSQIQQNNILLQQGNAAMSNLTPGSYTYKRFDGVTMYCIPVGSSGVTCKPL